MGTNDMDLFDQAPDNDRVIKVSLQEETENRYLNYAMSVITSRALPDVRDGLKPVQRRILYSMYHNLKLLPTAKFRKSAAVTGDVMGKFHPHGDQAIYDAMVRMAQPFSLRSPLVDGYGNFGSVDGDKAAAMRYTEVRLQPISLELLDELGQETVDFRDNFDGTLQEPIVLPARFPQLLVNGSAGIAVGMATNIPPHNLGEVMDALLMLMENPDATIPQLMRKIKGPDFPTGGELITPRVDRIKIYTKGRGSVVTRGEWKEEKSRSQKKQKTKKIIITSIPYNVTRATIVEKIAEIIISKKIPMLVDVRDESTEITRIVLEMKVKTEVDLVMAYLFKHTPLQQNFAINLTALVPTPNPLVAAPSKLSIKEILEQFLAFRIDVLRRRFEFKLAKLLRRIHILKGFEIIFHDLDEAIRIIRQSDGKKDAGLKLQKRFKIDEVQCEAVLETKLYRLARLEIKSIIEELNKLQAEADHIQDILDHPAKLSAEMRKEFETLKKDYAEPRRTRIREVDTSLQVQPEDFIQEEDTHVILTKNGWIKRIRTISEISSIRTREDDEVVSIMPGSTKESVCFFTDKGVAYTMRINDVVATTGYGNPLQDVFKFEDGERVLASFSLDPRAVGDIGLGIGEEDKETIPPTHLVAITEQGYGSRISLATFAEPSTKSGRRFVRRSKGDSVLFVSLCDGQESTLVVSKKKRYLMFPSEEIKFLSSPGKGVRLVQMDDGDLLFTATMFTSKEQRLRVETDEDDIVEFVPEKMKKGKRNSRGQIKRSVRGSWSHVLEDEIVIPSLSEDTTGKTENDKQETTTSEGVV
ncbi:MAG: DNA topoisomerase IV subunit A [Deltaproteobacteria bacterium]|nr:DNA topoisomerase IV subunit A [Deltaproteobacteria bacterium]|tara:strand:+ start:9324 stop:11756 length:2433 start_codon:yes stop_codon:yes gene_type:complete